MEDSWQATNQKKRERVRNERDWNIIFQEEKEYPHGVSWATKTISNKFIYLSGLAIFYLGWLENVSCVH